MRNIYLLKMCSIKLRATFHDTPKPTEILPPNMIDYNSSASLHFLSL